MTQMRGYDGAEDLGALRNFITACGFSDADLVADVHCKMMALNQAIKNADVVGIKIDLIKADHIWMDSPQLYLMATRDGIDV